MDLNLNTKNCDRCNMAMRLIPAGISKKTNKPYSAFWTCDKRGGGCGATASGGDSGGTEFAPTQYAAPSAAPSADPYGDPFATATAGPSQNDRLKAIEEKLDTLIQLAKGE